MEFYIFFPEIQPHISRNIYENTLYEVKGDVKSVFVNIWMFYSSEINMDIPANNSFRFFLADGRITGVLSYRVNGQSLNAGEGAMTSFIYDNLNRITDNGSCKFHYDDLGNRYSGNEDLIYDGTRLKRYTIRHKTINYGEDYNGIIENDENFVPQPYTAWYKDYEYNDLGELTRTLWYDREYIRIDDDIRIPATLDDDDMYLKQISEIRRTYNSGNLHLMITHTDHESGTVSYSEIIYDTYGNPVSQTEFNSNSTPNRAYEFEYIYDNNGNWVRMQRYFKHYRSGTRTLTMVAYREFEYAEAE